jgi:hypothetical protein|tara:strand:+ start:193 stop:795 length:603 start_codon:yes stop_codon:yes gene_type:complete
MGLKEEFTFLHNLGLNVTLFGKDLKKCHRGPGDRNFFVVVTRSDGDKLHYQDNIPEEDLSRLKNWIRCGDPTGLTAEWKEVHVGHSKWKAYLAGENQEIDCSRVMDEMFVNEGGKTYTYARTGEAKGVKITHPEDQIRLSNILSSFYKLEKLTSVQVSMPESSTVRPRAFLSLVASPPQNKTFTIKLAKSTPERHQVLWL